MKNKFNFLNLALKIKKNARKIVIGSMGFGLATTTSLAIALPIVIKNIAEEKAMDYVSKVLPIGGPVNSLRDNESVIKRGGKVNYLAIGDSITAGYNGYLATNDIIKDDVISNPIHARNINPSSRDAIPTPSNIVALENEIVEIEKLLSTNTLSASERTQKEQLRDFIKSQLQSYGQHTTTDYLSYADFLANSLAKNNRLGDYRNFALSGANIPNLREIMLRNTSAIAALKNADLISVSIGANDLMAAVEVLRLSWNALSGKTSSEQVSQFNVARDAIKLITGDQQATDGSDPNLQGANGNTKIDNLLRTDGSPRNGWRTSTPSGYASEFDTRNLVWKSFNKLVSMLSQGTLGGLFDIEQELLNSIFDLIMLDVATTVKELHAAAPQAKIVVMGYAFPFHLLPKSLTEDLIFQYDETQISSSSNSRTLNGHGTNLKEVFMNMIYKIRESVEKANYVKFFDINDLREFQDGSDKITYTLEGSAQTATSKPYQDEIVSRPEWDRAMPNPLDIHPSTYGHQLIGNHLFEWVASDLGMQIPKYESIQKINNFDPLTSNLDNFYTYANPDINGLYHDQGFIIRDEKAAYDAADIISGLQKLDNPSTLKDIGKYIQDYVDPLKVVDNYKGFMDILNNSLLSRDEKIDKALDLVKSIFKDGKGLIPSIIIDVIKEYINFDKLMEHFSDLSTLISDTNLTYDQLIIKAIDILKNIVDPVAKFGNVRNYTISQFLENISNVIQTIHWDKVDFNKVNENGNTDTSGIITDILDPRKGDGSILLELLTLFAIYMGDNGQSIGGNQAHTAPNANDGFIKNVVSTFTSDLKQTWSNYLVSIKNNEKPKVEGDSLIYLLMQFVEMNLNAPVEQGSKISLINLVKPDANGNKVPWVALDQSSTNFGLLIEEIKDLGKTLGLDITSFFNGITDMEDFGITLFLGDISGKKAIYKLFANAGIDVTTKILWTSPTNNGIIYKARNANPVIDLTSSIDSIWDWLIDNVYW